MAYRKLVCLQDVLGVIITWDSANIETTGMHVEGMLCRLPKGICIFGGQGATVGIIHEDQAIFVSTTEEAE